MISDRQLADAILARIPDGVRRFETARINCPILGAHWCVTMHEGDVCVSEVDPALSSALAKASVSLFRKRAEIAARVAPTARDLSEAEEMTW
jgi:hypothetical protein